MNNPGVSFASVAIAVAALYLGVSARTDERMVQAVGWIAVALGLVALGREDYPPQTGRGQSAADDEG